MPNATQYNGTFPIFQATDQSDIFTKLPLPLFPTWDMANMLMATLTFASLLTTPLAISAGRFTSKKNINMEWIYDIKDPLWETTIGSLLIFVVIILVTRIIGLRSFAKFTAYDFAFTVAIGSIISSTLTSSTSIAHGSVAIASLLLITYIFSFLQRALPKFSSVISNKPLLLMDGSEILYGNLKYARIEKTQLIAKLREANVIDYGQVKAVVLESTGDISVLHSSDDTAELNQELLEGVRRKP
nr:YetF domain-containing protein [uncultured Allomuricauda sp.]